MLELREERAMSFTLENLQGEAHRRDCSSKGQRNSEYWCKNKNGSRIGENIIKKRRKKE